MAIQIDGDSGVSGVNGSATTPALQGTDSNTGIVFGTDEVQIATGGSTRATVDSSGRLLLGHSSSRDVANVAQPKIQIEGTNVSTSTLSVIRNSNDAGGPVLALSKTRGTSTGSSTVVQSGDTAGSIYFSGADGTDVNSYAAWIEAAIDGTPGGNDTPGRLVFSTTANGANSPTERLRIDNGGRFFFNENSSDLGHKYILSGNETADVAAFQYNSNTGTYLAISTGAPNGNVEIKADARSGSFPPLTFKTGANERGRFTSGGDFLLGTTSQFSGSSSSATGHRFEPSGVVSHFRSGGASLYVGRQSNDGIIVSIRQAGNEEGSITVSGSTVSYNGGHLARWSQLAGGVERTEILRGSVLSNLDEMCEWAYEAQDAVLYTEEDELPEGASVGDVKTPAVAAGTENNEQLNRMKVSDVEGDVNVAGVFQAWDDDDDTYTNDFYCAMTGDFIIRIAQGTTVARGDLLMSAGDGTAKPQDDDIVRSKTIAKVTSTTVSTTYSDGSYCVPCVLMAC